MKIRNHLFLIALLCAALTSRQSIQAATLTVTSANDSGPGSLRQAILDASSGDMINFAAGITTINLLSDELLIDKNLTITGPGADRLTVRRSTNAPEFRIFNITSGTVFISRLTISNGSVSGFDGDGDGGGIRSAGVLTLAHCTISANQADGTELVGGRGGGVLNDSGTMTITRCIISNNSAQYTVGSSGDCAFGAGGGIMNYSGGSLTITYSTISGNSCSVDDGFGFCGSTVAGGGIRNSGSMTVTNCTISGNSIGGGSFVTAYGGGISNSGNLQITSSTIGYNSASADYEAFGGGIYGSGPTGSNSSIIALNSAPTGPDFTGGELQSMGYNIIGNNADAAISSQPTDQTGTPGSPIDPLLGPLHNNGGPTLTMALLAGSPAINRGDPNALPYDQRGYARLGIPDVGAFEFGGVAPPVATTNTAGNITSSSATLNGTVNPNGLTTTVHFQYGTTTHYGFTTGNRSYTGNTTQSVSANITGLTLNTTYHFRLVGTNNGGTSYGDDRTFRTFTATGPPVVTTSAATNVASFSATLNGSVYPHGLTTTVYFQYGTTTSYGLHTVPQSHTGNTYLNVSANISGLSASTTYHFRIVATNSFGTTHGGDRTFTTLSATGPPVVTTNPATLIASFSATLNGSLDPHGLPTNVYFQYGTTTSYGLHTVPQSQSGNTYRNVSANISGLTTHTTYHFRIVATNSAGTRFGSDRTFTTP
jgi:hypothetical protein